MEILTYTEKHQAFRKRLQGFMDKEAAPFADKWEQDKIVPREVWTKLGRAGFLCTAVSREYGGMGGDFRYSIVVIEELLRARCNGFVAPLHSDIIVPYIEAFGNEKQKQDFLPGCVNGDIVTAIAMTEPGAGSDLAGMTTTAVEDGDQVVINGSKTFISNGINADLIVVAARDPEVENPHQAISLYLVEADRAGFARGKQLDKMGLHAQDTTELFFTDCRIPAGNRLAEKGWGFLMLMQKLQQERLITALMAQAAAGYILDTTTAFLKETIVSGRPLTRSQSIQFALVEMATELRLGQTFVDKLAVDHMEGKEVITETSMAKYWVTDMVWRTANRCLELYRDAGMLESCPIVRALRDVRVMSIFAGTNEIMKGIAAKFMGL